MEYKLKIYRSNYRIPCQHEPVLNKIHTPTCLHDCTRYAPVMRAYVPTYLHWPTGLYAHIQAYVPTCLYAYGPTRLQAYMPTRLQAYAHTCLCAQMQADPFICTILYEKLVDKMEMENRQTVSIKRRPVLTYCQDMNSQALW